MQQSRADAPSARLPPASRRGAHAADRTRGRTRSWPHVCATGERTRSNSGRVWRIGILSIARAVPVFAPQVGRNLGGRRGSEAPPRSWFPTRGLAVLLKLWPSIGFP